MGIVLITGAATGMGRTCAIELSKAGFIIAANYRSQAEGAESLLKELAGDGHQLFQADITKPEEAENLVANVVETYGGLDALVNAAGRYTEQSVRSSSFEEWQNAWHASIEVNLLAPVNLAYHVAHIVDPITDSHTTRSGQQ